MGCNYDLFFDTAVTSLALRRFYNNTGGPRWPAQFRRGWEAEEPCAWDGNERAHPPPYGVRCVNGGWHTLPPRADGGLLSMEHYSGEAEGEIPREFKAFQMTSAIGLSYNRLNGTMWDTSYHCFLQHLDVAHNRISGTLPDDFMVRNIHAEIINMAFNQLSGTLPRSLTRLTSLVVLLLDHNNFTGEIPDFSYLQHLHHLSLGYNNFTGRIGTWLRNMSTLGWLELEHNKLQGPLPPLPRSVTRVNFAGNNFTGAVPESYGKHGYLRYFNCTGCTLTCPQKDMLAHLRYSSHCTGSENVPVENKTS
ncbi:Leucine-rich repeat transmembrane protein kinase [Trypanosoma theileri]|uniref:Leucine-rich repeat transmembrane protein kinase n=1 Tax=Trypanosoma theileri TaxID=67003 RepID=A0A1X0P596_9TRYP|nr:Leucine-rich repeat transmembrane protein kinase [Trypanosoma theileri]ORC92011.1 Leucine-rich repeat transmembrane protein kinase [Trypanosoma theileri]